MTSLQIPGAFSDVFGLGTPLAVYPAKKGSRWGMFVIMLLLFAGSGVALLWGAYNAYTRYLKFGPAIVMSSLTFPWIVAGVLFLIALGLARSVYNNWKIAAVIYQNGLAYRDRKGIRAWRWDEFGSLTSAVTKHYTNGIYTGTTHVYTLGNRNGESFKLTDTITDVENLVGEIRKNIFPLLYDLYAQAYNQGQTLTFGPVKLSKDGGIQIGKKVYPWNEIEQVGIQK
ncbi:MAG: DUF6585 family protein, partial [Anaerolineales bacterium]